MKNKFTESDKKKIEDCRKIIEELQKKAEMAWDVLILNLPDIPKNEEDYLWDYVWCNTTGHLILDEKGLRFDPTL